MDYQASFLQNAVSYSSTAFARLSVQVLFLICTPIEACQWHLHPLVPEMQLTKGTQIFATWSMKTCKHLHIGMLSFKRPKPQMTESLRLSGVWALLHHLLYLLVPGRIKTEVPNQHHTSSTMEYRLEVSGTLCEKLFLRGRYPLSHWICPSTKAKQCPDLNLSWILNLFRGWVETRVNLAAIKETWI